jgi:hypothetical protein
VTFDDLRRFRNATPFRPFRLVLSDGRRLLVRAPEKIGWHPEGRLLTVYTRGDVSDTVNVDTIIDVQPGSKTFSNGRSH